MGVRRIFSRGGENFKEGGGTTKRYYLHKTAKKYYFAPKSIKNTIFKASPGSHIV